MKNLTIFGDSILKGVVYDSERSRYSLCAKELKRTYEDGKFSVERFCNMGNRIDDGLFWIQRCYEKSCPQNVLIEFGGNDSMHDWKQVSEHPELQHYPFTAPESFEEKYQSAVDFLKGRGANVKIANLIPIDAEKYMNFLSKGLSYENILSWLGDTSMLYRWHEYYNRIVENLAVRNGCTLIDLRSEFLLSHDFQNLIGDDGMHPTPQGHEIIEKKILSTIK